MGRKHLIELVIIFLVALGAAYFVFTKPVTAPVSVSPSPSNDEFCIQVITPARNPKTGEVRDFPTPCDVPEGWEIVQRQETGDMGQVDTSDWKTYRNEEYGFEFKYPGELIASPHQYSGGFQVWVRDNIEVNIREDEYNTPLDQYIYLESEPLIKSSAILGGKTAIATKVPNGYCDGPGCSRPFVVYSTKIGNYFYNLVFYGDTQIDSQEMEILSTFKFTR